MSELKEVYELEIARNAEGSKLAYMSLKDGETGYRIAGPKAWGGSKELASIEIRQDDLVEFVLSYAPQALAEILRRAQPEAAKPAQDLSAAILALCRDIPPHKFKSANDFNFYEAGFIEARSAAAALASQADALVAGDSETAKDAERYRWYRSCGDERDQLAILDARGNIIPEELDAEIDARIAAIQAQKDGA